jgi:hypothetical protein
MMTAWSLASLAAHDAGPNGLVISLHLDRSGRVHPRPDDVNRAIDGLVRHARQSADAMAVVRQHADVEIVPSDAIPWPDPVVTVARF